MLAAREPEPKIKTDRDDRNSSVRKIVQAIAAISIAVAGIIVFVITMDPGRMDFISYWAAAKLLIHHADPYSTVRVFALEKADGLLGPRPLIMRNPPWAIFLAVPLGLAGVRFGLFLWTLAAVGSILISAQLLDVHSHSKALAFAFAPAIACICSGQSSVFLLPGFSLFLYFHRSRPYIAGASLLLMAIKPHLFLIFWAVLLADCICRRNFLIVAGIASALAAATAFSMCLDVRIWPQYLAMVRVSPLDHELFPTGSMLFRILLDPRSFWLLFVPSAVAILWGLWYYLRRRDIWDWRVHGMLLMLVTVTVSPYSFISDSIVLLPSIAFALSYPQKRKYSGWILLFINCLALFIMIGVHSLASPALVWFPAALLAWFLYSVKRCGRAVRIPAVQSIEPLANSICTPKGKFE